MVVHFTNVKQAYKQIMQSDVFSRNENSWNRGSNWFVSLLSARTRNIQPTLNHSTWQLLKLKNLKRSVYPQKKKSGRSSFFVFLFPNFRIRRFCCSSTSLTYLNKKQGRSLYQCVNGLKITSLLYPLVKRLIMHMSMCISLVIVSTC